MLELILIIWLACWVGYLHHQLDVYREHCLERRVQTFDYFERKMELQAELMRIQQDANVYRVH